jgi:hypothetical protein
MSFKRKRRTPDDEGTRSTRRAKPEDPLTTTEIRNAKPEEKAFKLFDGRAGRGLFLLVTTAGGKL